MIEYVAQENDYNPGDEFGDEAKPSVPAKAEKPAKPAKAKPEADPADEEDMPF